jgi:beta-lactamase class A
MVSTGLWDRLQDQITSMVKRFPGVAGVCVKDLERGTSFAIRGTEVFPTASTIKMHVLMQLLLRADAGEIDLDQKVRVRPEAHVPGSGVISRLVGEIELSWLNLATLMIVASDNTAANLCIEAAGMDATNALLRSLGLKRTVLRRRMLDLEAVARSEENVSTPAECVALLELLYKGKPTPSVGERCLSILQKKKTMSLFDRAVPAGIPVASKPGRAQHVCCDAGIVLLPRQPYAMAVMTKFAFCGLLEQERLVVDMARVIHQAMAVLDSTNDCGLGLLP